MSRVSQRDYEAISNKVADEEPLTLHQRERLISQIFTDELLDDDPKRDDSNQEWLGSMSDEDLLKKYEEICR